MASIIKQIEARKIFNNRGEETMEVDVTTVNGFGRASSPAGKSIGKTEVEYYPKGGVSEAIQKLYSIISPKIIGLNADFQNEVDGILTEIDGTSTFENIGGNTSLAVSLANAEAAASAHGLLLFQFLGGIRANALPFPLSNMISGGKHTLGKSPDIQDFLALPYGAHNFLAASEANLQIHKKIGDQLKKRGTSNVGKSEEGSWSTNVETIEALEILHRNCVKVGESLGIQCGLGIDVAASSLWDKEEQKYNYEREGKKRDKCQQLEYIMDLIERYNLIYVEDPFHDEDYESFADLTRKTKNCLICGDDLFTTHEDRLKKGISCNAGNAILIKVNQVGTVTSALNTINTARRFGYTPIFSHRSGDTVDCHIVHIAVGLGCPLIKVSCIEGTRAAKINELIRIENFLGDKAKMAELNLA